MRKFILGSVFGVVCAGAVMTGANVWAAQQSPSVTVVTCKKINPCVNKNLTSLTLRVNALATRVAALRKRNRTLNTCLAEYPVSKQTLVDNYYYPYYNDQLANAATAPGYFNDYDYEGQSSPGILGETQSGNSVDVWMVRDTCATSAYVRPPSP